MADTTEPGLPVAKSDGVARKLLRACGAKERPARPTTPPLRVATQGAGDAPTGQATHGYASISFHRFAIWLKMTSATIAPSPIIANGIHT